MPYEITCSRCRRVLRIAEGNTRPSLTCPHCLALVANPHALVRADLPAALPYTDSLDAEVQRDSHGGAVVAGVLAGMVLLGVFGFLASGGLNQVSLSSAVSVVLGLGILVLGAIATGTIAIASSSKSRAASTVTGVLGGLFIGAGVVVLIVVLMCMGIWQTCTHLGK